MTPINPKLSNSSCSECGSGKEISASGYIICTDCGTAKLRSYVDHLPIKIDENFRYHSQNSIGKSLNYVGTLGSEIGYQGNGRRETGGGLLHPRTVYKYRRLSKFYHQRAKFENNATHLRTMVIFNRICNQLNISDHLKQRSLYIYWQNVKKEIDITNHVLLVALSLLLAVREARDRAPIRFSEIISTFADNGHRVTNKNILRLARDLNLNLAPVRRRAEDYIERVASGVRWDIQILRKLETRPTQPEEYEVMLIRLSLFFLSLLDRKQRGGVQPFPFAVSIIYLSDRAISKYLQRRPLLTQKLLANAVDSAEFTIRDHVYRFLGDLYKQYESELIDFISKIK